MHQEEVLALLTVVKTCAERFTGPGTPANETLENLKPSDFTCEIWRRRKMTAPDYKTREVVMNEE